MLGRHLALLLFALSLAACRSPGPADFGGAASPESPTAPPAATPRIEAARGSGTAPGAIRTSAQTPRAPLPEPPPGAAGDLIRQGRAIVDNTPVAGPRGGGPGRLAAGGRLSCRNCHLDGGTRQGAFPWLGLATAYPRYEPRAGRPVTLAEQVNACLTRCLNVPPLPPASREMRAILAYIAFLPAATSPAAATSEFPPRRVDLAAGAEVYRRHCLPCHASNGAGRRSVPPLWGPGSYGTGSAMHRVLVAAAFIQAQMPPGMPGLGAEQAYDVAAYVNSFVRPETGNLQLDYPALTEKPVDVPYPPYPDRFPVTRHKYGPFRDILEEWAALGRDGRP